MIFYKRRVIRVSRPGNKTRFRIIRTVSIRVFYKNTDWRSGCVTVENAADDMELIFFTPCGRNDTRRPSECELRRNLIFVDLYACRNSVKYRTDLFAVALAEQRYGNIVPERIFHFRHPVSF